MNTLICKDGYCIPKDLLSKKDILKIESELTVSPENNFGNFIVKSFKVYKETSNYYIIPVYYALNNFTSLKPKIIFSKINKINITDTIKLRDNQIECFKKCYDEFSNPYGGGIINLSTGSGKTLTAIKLICKAKLKSLVIVNKIELLNQWRKEIIKWVPNVKIGIIQGSIFEYENCDIVLGMLQTISIKNKLKSIDFSWVNIAIFDEVHNLNTEIFSKVLFKVRPRYIFGLTATLERKDKLEKIIKWFIGDVLYSNISTELKQPSEVHIYKYFGESSIEKQLRDGTAAVARMLTNIGNDNERSDMIIDILKKLSNDKNRNILVISDRISQLKYINKALTDISGLFIGSLKNKELEISKEKQIILGTYPLVNEGFNLPKLNCILFATPRSSITQAIGRIYRKNHNIIPIIIDIYDEFSIFKGQHFRRKNIYKKSIKNCKLILKNNNDTTNTTELCLFDEDEENEIKCLIDD